LLLKQQKIFLIHECLLLNIWQDSENPRKEFCCRFGILTNTKIYHPIYKQEKFQKIQFEILSLELSLLTTGGLSNFNVEKCSVLAGHTVVLFPDLNGFDKWNIKRKELSERIPNTRFEVSDLLENIATEQERNDGLDIADYLLRFDHKQFVSVTTPPSFETLVQLANDEAINWFNGHLLQSMELSDTSFCDSLIFDSG